MRRLELPVEAALEEIADFLDTSQKFGMVNRMGAHVCACVCGCAPAHTRELDCSQMKTLVIAEKPSVAQDIVRALTPTAGKFEKHDEYFESDTYVVSSAVGHLVEIQAPEEFDVKRGKWSFAHLPVIPPHFDLKPVDKTKTRLNAVVKLAKRKDVGQLINACDAGREGELIFRLIEQYAGGAKPLGKPKRAFISVMAWAISLPELKPMAWAMRCRRCSF